MITHTGIFIQLVFLGIELAYSDIGHRVFLTIDITPLIEDWSITISLTFFAKSFAFRFPKALPEDIAAAEETIAEFTALLDKAKDKK